MKRGQILMNGDDFYMLVRVEEDAPVRNANGTKVSGGDRYNLVNLSTGKTRVSKSDRLFIMPVGQEDVDVQMLRVHFNLPGLADTGVHITDVDLKDVIARAVTAARSRAATQFTVDRWHQGLLADCISQLRALGLAV